MKGNANKYGYSATNYIKKGMCVKGMGAEYKIKTNTEQAGAELGQAQLKVGLDFNFFNFFVDLVSLDLDS